MRQPIVQLAQRRQRGQHPGLILQRYLAKAVTGSNGDPAERRALLDAAVHATQSESLRAVYADVYTRWNDSFPRDDLNLAVDLRTVGRLMVGLGSENVLETGIRLHHTYGVPLIPGSALKGLASHYCHEVWGQRHVEPPGESNRLFRRRERYHCLLFGTTEDGGVITFHDAWITPASLSGGSLRLDVMTPHHPKWQTNEAPPTDFDSPVPVSFLSAVGTFQVRLSWSGPIETPQEQSQAWTRLAMNLLQEALTEWGVGGKTSSGYGRLITANTVQPIPSVPTGTRVRTQDVPKPGVCVEAVLSDARTKKGGWKAKHEPSGLAGPVQNSADIPDDKKAGDTLALIVASVSANQREIAFRYPTDADQQRATRSQNKSKGSPRDRRHHGRR